MKGRENLNLDSSICEQEAHEKKLEYQRRRRKLNNNSWTKKYEKSPNGFLMRLYRNMYSRINGIQKAKAHLYVGKYLLPKDNFYVWAKSSKNFWNMYEAWVSSKYNRKLTPTVDRIDSSKGYCVENMQWLTHSENSGKVDQSKRKKT